MIKLTIVTINRNNAAGLENTMKSVLLQTSCDYEYIVVDGASTDGSVEVIERLAPEFGTRIKWLSEPDTGIYNAMNKGCRMANGEYLLMLNSADILVDEHVVEKILPSLHDTDIIQGNILYKENGQIIRNRGYAHSDIRFDEILDAAFLHQASFIRKDLLYEVGFYDDSYKKIADTAFYIYALIFHKASFRYIDMDISVFDMNGITNSGNPYWQDINASEVSRLYSDILPNRFIDYYRYSQKRIEFYENLHRLKLIWYCAVGLSVLSRKICGPYRKVHKELVKQP